jgi:hypothetical protein
MPALVLTLIAPIGAWIHLRRHPEPRSRERTLRTFLLWWLVLPIGLAGVGITASHVFNAAATAEDIGFTRGDGGFQFENAMGDLAIGVTGLLCVRFRNPGFWLAVLLVTAIQYYGDAYGHVYQWIENDNTEQGNVGPPLWVDVIVPTVGLALYAAYQPAARAVASADAPAPADVAVAER